MWKMPTDIEPILLLLSSACELSQAARPLALIACKHPPVPFREFWGFDPSAASWALDTSIPLLVPSVRPTFDYFGLLFWLVRFMISMFFITVVGGYSGVGATNLPGEIGSGTKVLEDRRSWMGGRSRTLAPPRGAAWIVDPLLIWRCKTNQMRGTQLRVGVNLFSLICKL